jgi:hypothetical protein
MVEVVCSFLKLTLNIYPIKISMQQESLCVKNNVVEAKKQFPILSHRILLTQKNPKKTVLLQSYQNILLTYY